MQRRNFLKSIGKGLCAAGTLSLFSGCSFSTKPNILLIVTDDHGYADMGCTGLADDVKTPNMDRLAQKGVRFTQAYATSPICSPSRMSIITGVYNQRFGTYWYGGKGIHKEQFSTIPEILKQEGYNTGYVGKVHYGSHKYDSDPGNRNFPMQHGFDYFYGFTSPRKHYLKHNAAAERHFQKVKKEHNKWGQSLRQGPMWINDKQQDQSGFSTHLFGDKCREFIDRIQDQPFFLQLSFNAVHNFTHQLPKEYLEKHDLKGYHDWNPAKEDYYQWYKEGRKPNNPEGRAHYLGQLYYLDKEIGKVIDHLEEKNLRKDTLIIMISDNGGSTPIYANNSPFRGSKYTLYEGGIRVPMIISWPGSFRQRAVSKNMASGLDILPTICNAGGAEIPENIDGLDLTPILKRSQTDYGHGELVWDTGTQTAVRKGKWKLRTATSKKSQDYEMVELELGEFLYNLEEDPGETTNLKDQYPEVFDQLKKIYKNWKKDIKN
ncbi:MAG TPA: sulfatase-like hydrolase/transferase [bacterium]|nr:sulfatase-like hydrolase/transferase [bacterium]